MEELLKEIEDNTEWLWTSNLEDEVECIGIENLKGLLEGYQKKQRAILNTLILSCEEGMDGRWDVCNDEGGFEAMISLMTKLYN